MNEIQTNAANKAAQTAVEVFRQARRDEWTAERDAIAKARMNDPAAAPEEPYPGTVGTDEAPIPVEVALSATVRKAFEDAFGGIVSMVNPGEAQRRAADGAIPGAGMQRDGVSGHLIGVEPAPLPITTPSDYPKWIKPHDSHITRSETGVVTVAGSNGGIHVARGSGEVTVLCQDEEDEKRYTEALAEPSNDGADENGNPRTDGQPVTSYDPTMPGGDPSAQPQATDKGIGGGDPTGAKTHYPAESADVEKADPEGVTGDAADVGDDAAEHPKSKDKTGKGSKAK